MSPFFNLVWEVEYSSRLVNNNQNVIGQNDLDITVSK